MRSCELVRCFICALTYETVARRLAVQGVPGLILFHESFHITGALKRIHERSRGERRRLFPRGSLRLPDALLRRTGRGKVAAQYHTARFRFVPSLAKVLNVLTSALRKPGTA